MNFTTISKAKKETGLSYLGKINISAKLAKNGKVNHQYTYGIYLAPANTSGYNVCSHSTPECRLGCLATSGRAGMEIVAGIKSENILNIPTFKALEKFTKENVNEIGAAINQEQLIPITPH